MLGHVLARRTWAVHGPCATLYINFLLYVGEWCFTFGWMSETWYSPETEQNVSCMFKEVGCMRNVYINSPQTFAAAARCARELGSSIISTLACIRFLELVVPYLTASWWFFRFCRLSPLASWSVICLPYVVRNIYIRMLALSIGSLPPMRAYGVGSCFVYASIVEPSQLGTPYSITYTDRIRLMAQPGSTYACRLRQIHLSTRLLYRYAILDLSSSPSASLRWHVFIGLSFTLL